MSIKEIVIAYRNQNPIYRTLLGTVLGEFDRVSKEPTDDQCTQIIKKMIDSLMSIKGIKEQEEAFILGQFVPSQLSEDKIKGILSINSFNSIKDCMAFFKANYPSQYDGKLVSKLFNEK